MNKYEMLEWIEERLIVAYVRRDYYRIAFYKLLIYRLQATTVEDYLTLEEALHG